MLKRVFWLIVVAIGGWIAWQWFRQRQSELGDSMPHFAPAYQYTPPAPPASIASQAPARLPSDTAPASSTADTTPEPASPAIAAHELDELFADDAPAPPAASEPDAPAPEAAEDSDDSEIVGYCMRCRTKRPMQHAHEEISESGRRAARGTCPVCGTNMFVFLAADDERGAAK